LEDCREAGMYEMEEWINGDEIMLTWNVWRSLELI